MPDNNNDFFHADRGDDSGISAVAVELLPKVSGAALAAFAVGGFRAASPWS